MNIDLTNLTLAAILALGVVNVIMIFRPTTDSRIKFALSVIVAFAVGFIPADLGNLLATHIKDALGVAFLASGGYTLAKRAGGQ